MRGTRTMVKFTVRLAQYHAKQKPPGYFQTVLCVRSIPISAFSHTLSRLSFRNYSYSWDYCFNDTYITYEVAITATIATSVMLALKNSCQ